MDDQGIIFLNAGTKMLPRLVVSINSLRKHSTSDISILSIDGDGHDYCQKLCEYFDIKLVTISKTLANRKHYWFEKARLHLYTPFNTSIFLDSDTVVLRNFDELFDEVKKNDFIASQFAHWKSSGRTIRKRLRQWSSTDHNLVEDTIKRDIPSVNMGLYGFKKSSELMKHWFDLTIKHPTASLPEETTCHLLLTQYKSKIVSNIYNCSCKHDNPRDKEVKVVHYHGRKHCRLDESYRLKFNGSIWIQHWKDVLDKNICDIQNWYDKCGDRYLNKLMKNIDKVRI
jgi:hypothetical protein